MAADDTDVRRTVPRTDAVLNDPRLVAATARFGSQVVKDAVHTAQDAARHGVIPVADVADLAVSSLPPRPSSLRPVINATGVVLHTNLGRAPLSGAAIDAITDSAGYVDVEYDLTTGQRAQRGRGTLEALAQAVPDAGGVHVVNNGAAALVLAATALATGREIVVSRGELVEIGDGFRLPDLLETTGARLREVGTTNRTTVGDYREAVGDTTGFVLKVHPSNFVVTGFTSAVTVTELSDFGVPLVVDIGSGLLAADPALPGEPDAASALRAGATLVTASGDKLLGGPQAGLLFGDAAVVARLRRHPLARALRVDKLTLAALEATLRGPRTPTFTAIHVAPRELKQRTERVAATVGAPVVDSDGVVGGGGAPGLRLPGYAVALPVDQAVRLRLGDPCIVTRVADGRCLVDLRCVPPESDDAVIAAISGH